MTSLAGKAYCLTSDDTLSLIDDEDDLKSKQKKRPQIKVVIRSRDTFFSSNDKSFKRIFVSNCLDQRYFDSNEKGLASQQHDISKRLRDPYE